MEWPLNHQHDDAMDVDQDGMEVDYDENSHHRNQVCA